VLKKDCLDLPDKIYKTLVFSMTKEQIEARIQRRIDAIQPAQVVSLKKIYASLRDGMSAAADWFEMGGAETAGNGSAPAASRTDSVKEKLKASTATASPPHDAETGEVKDEVDQQQSPADAYRLGQEARAAGKALKAVPPEFRSPEMEAYASAWQDGWRARDEEMSSEKK
jgi:hypothetical protein